MRSPRSHTSHSVEPHTARLRIGHRDVKRPWASLATRADKSTPALRCCWSDARKAGQRWLRRSSGEKAGLPSPLGAHSAALKT